MSTLELKELSHPSGEVIKIAAGKTLDLKVTGYDYFTYRLGVASCSAYTQCLLQQLHILSSDTFTVNNTSSTCF